MFKNDNTDSDSNFWISYADLMAGLLFVFILLIGAIVVKSSILKNELHDKEDSLAKSLALVSVRDDDLIEKDKLIAKNTEEMKKDKSQLTEQDKALKLKDAYILNNDMLLAERNKALEEEKSHLSKAEKELQRKNALLAKDELLLSENERLLKLKHEEIDNLNKLLLIANTKADNLNGKIVIVQKLLNTKENILDETKKALEDEKKSLDHYKGKVLVLSDKLSDTKDIVKIKDDKLLALLAVMDDKKTKYDDLIVNLQKKKEKIKSLTGIKLQVVASLKKALGSKINIDKKTGSLRLASNILFDAGQATLKDEAKIELKKSFEEYIGTLVTDKDIKPHLDKIIIEGHTDSDGGYMFNLALSQKRALAVMKYFLTLDFSRQHNIRPLMTASGRSYLDVIVKDGIEDKEASRRIEIKFRLKNEDAMQEIEKVLDAN